jgi:hypothetical protein
MEEQDLYTNQFYLKLQLLAQRSCHQENAMFSTD